MSHPIEFLPAVSPATEEIPPGCTQPYLDYRTANADLHSYPGSVVSREAMQTPSELPYATIYEEKLRFSDGAVRTLTRVDPKTNYFAPEQLNPYLVSAGDALCTGPSGFNAKVIDELAKRGFAVAWLHHQGRQSERPTTMPKAMQFARFILKKSIGRSAHHQHGMLDDLALNSDHNTQTVLSIGDSRSAMIGEAVDALAELYGRSVYYSDYNASCFEHRPTLSELPGLALSLPHESGALIRLAIKAHQSPDLNPADYMGTFDLHPLNLVHEATWLIPLMRGDAGRYGDAVPLDQNGVRTHLNGDTWSSGGKAWEAKYTIRPNIYLIQRGLTDGRKARHLDLADPVVQGERYDRLERVTEEIISGHERPNQLDMRYVVKNMRSVKPRRAV